MYTLKNIHRKGAAVSLYRFHVIDHSQWWSGYILQTLIDTHDVVSSTLDMSNKLR